MTFTALGNIDPDMSYGFFAKNNTNTTQTYTVSYGESIAPTINGKCLVSPSCKRFVCPATGARLLSMVA